MNNTNMKRLLFAALLPLATATMIASPQEDNSGEENCINVAPLCSEVEASYTSSWNYLYAIYDGTIGYGELANGYTWATWSTDRPKEQWLRYGWNDKVTVNKTNVYFWTDTNVAGNNVHVPESWKVQYWNLETSSWQDVELMAGQSYGIEAKAPNEVKFKPVETTQLRMVMEAASDGVTYSALGVTEWEVMGTIDAKEVVYGDYPIENADFSKVHLSDKFWTARMEQTQSVTIPIALEQCYKTNRVLNFQKAAAILRGENIGYFDTENTFDDTDIYKILEGMAYSVQSKPNADLDKKMDELIEIIGAAQEPDGYSSILILWRTMAFRLCQDVMWFVPNGLAVLVAQATFAASQPLYLVISMLTMAIASM